MNAIEFSQRLLQSEPGSPEAAALARDLVEDARYPAHFVLRHYLSSTEQDDQMKAKNVLADLREFALVPLADSASSPNQDTELWVMRTITQELVALRSRAASVLKDLLANRRSASPATEGSSASHLPPDTRVCDLAFVLLRRILHLESASSAFFGMTPVERDKRIKEFQKSREFRAAFESQS
jgi:hypothetical protein